MEETKPDTINSEKDELRELEKEKLRLEILEIKNPWNNWYKKTNYWGVIVTLIIAIITGIWTYSSGILDIKYENLKLEKNSLQRDINMFNDEKDAVHKELLLVKDRLKSLRKDYDSTALRLSVEYRAKEKLRIEKLSVEERCKYYKFQLDSITNAVIKSQSIVNALVDENGNRILTEDGEYITFDGKNLTFGGNPITSDRTDITVNNDKITVDNVKK